LPFVRAVRGPGCFVCWPPCSANGVPVGVVCWFVVLSYTIIIITTVYYIIIIIIIITS